MNDVRADKVLIIDNYLTKHLFKVSCLTPPLKAKDELNETDEKRAAAVKELRAMIKEKADAGDDLAKGVQDTFGEKPDGLMVRFIRARKYDVVRAFDLMKGKDHLGFTNSIFFHLNIKS